MFFRQTKYGFLILILVALLTACAQREQGIRAGVMPSAETSQLIARFSQMGDEVYTKTVKGDFLEARKEIIQMSDLIPQMRLEGVTTVQGVKALADTLLQAIKVYNAVQLDTEQALFQSARIRLMADALSHPNTPLWLQYNKVIQEELHVMEQANKQKKYEDLKLAFLELKTLYHSIQPALQVSLQEDEALKLEAAFLFMQNELQATPVRPVNLVHALKALQALMDSLFQIKAEATAYLPFMEPNEPNFHWMIVLAAIIMITLSFAAWRMRTARNDIITINRKM
jgi:sporulation protein YpjB